MNAQAFVHPADQVLDVTPPMVAAGVAAIIQTFGDRAPLSSSELPALAVDVYFAMRAARPTRRIPRERRQWSGRTP